MIQKLSAMKKTLLTIIICFVAAFSANAQISLGGRMSFGGNTKDGRFEMDLSPDICYSFGDFCAGAILELSFTNKNSEGSPQLYSIGGTAYLQYYFWSAGPVSLFAEADIKATRELYNPEEKAELRWKPSLSPGLEIKLSDHWSVIGYLGEISWDSISTSWNVSLSPSDYSLGVYYTF